MNNDSTYIFEKVSGYARESTAGSGADEADGNGHEDNGHERVPTSMSAAAPAFAELATIVLQGQPLGAVLTRIARIAADLVPGADEVSITIIEREQARSVAFSHQLAVVLDERQYQDGFGPCLDAAVSGMTIAVEDTAADLTYPEFAAQAARAGIRHTLAIPLPANAQGRTGAINLYGRGAPFDEDARNLATGFAAYAAVAVTNAAVYVGALEEVEQMRVAMASRAVIEQAKGIIMAGRRCSSDEAFHLLRDASSRANRKLRDIAQDLVDSTVA